jgi:hypothetical protein
VKISCYDALLSLSGVTTLKGGGPEGAAAFVT